MIFYFELQFIYPFLLLFSLILASEPRLDPDRAREALLSNRWAPIDLKFYMSITTETVNREYPSQAEAKEFAGLKLVFFRIVFQVVVRILQVLRNVQIWTRSPILKFDLR